MTSPFFPAVLRMQRVKKEVLLCAAAWVLAAASGPAWGGGRKVTAEVLETLFGKPAVPVPVVSSSPQVDGKLDDAAWKDVPRCSLTLNTGKGSPHHRTWFKVVSDRENLYICLWCAESRMDRLVCAVKKTDGPLWADDSVEVFFDPGHTEGFSYAHLIVNPAGVAYHARAGKKAWNPPSLKIAPFRAEDAWGLEMRIAFKDLVDGPVPRLWGFNVMRMRRPKPGDVDFTELKGEALKKVLDGMEPEESAWSPTLMRTSHVPSRFGHLYLAGGEKEDGMIARYRAGKSLKPPGRFPVRARDINRLMGAPTVMVPVVEKGPVVDGELDDPAWKGLPELRLLVNRGGGEPVHKTVVKMVTDRENLYFCYKCFDSEMEFLVADAVEKGEVHWGEDTVEIFIDPYHTHRVTYYNIMINPLGSYRLAKNGFDRSWDPPSFVVKTALKKDHWTVECKIAFKDLLKDPADFPTVWSLNFIRTRQPKFDKKFEDTAWAPTNQNASHIPEMFGHAYFELGKRIPRVVREFIKARDALVK